MSEKKIYNVKTRSVAAVERRARKNGVGVSVSVGGSYAGGDSYANVSGLLPRIEFDDMFEKVVTGMDAEGNEIWYIQAKRSVVCVGDFVAYKEDGSLAGGTGVGVSSLGELTDVLLNSPSVGDVLTWNGFKWVNRAINAGLDESALASYLTSHNYVTSSALDGYVTLGTEQTISGKKKFTAYETEFGSRIISTGSFDSFENTPHFMWHVPNTRWTKALMDTFGNIHFLDGGATDLYDYRKLIAGGYMVNGGTSAQFLKADGSVDGTQYLFHRRTDSGFDIDAIDSVGGGLYEVPSAAGSLPFNKDYWQKVFDFGANDNGYRVQLNTPLTLNGSLYLRHKIGGTWNAWRKILDSSNYPALLDSRYVNATGDIMTGNLYIATDALVRGIRFGVDDNADFVGRATTYVTLFNNTALAELKIHDNGVFDFCGSNIRFVRPTRGTVNGYVDSVFIGCNNVVSNECVNITFGKAQGQNNLGYIGHVHVADGSSSNYVTIGGFAADRLFNVLYNGNVGIGTEQPRYKLDVANGDIIADGWVRTTGARGWYNESYGGGIYMDNSAWVKIFQKPLNISNQVNIGANAFNVGLSISKDDHAALEVSAGSITMGLGCHSNGHWYWWRGTSDPWSTTGKNYVMDYDGSTWYFTGNILATGEVTFFNGSDRRIKTNLRIVSNALGMLRGLGGYYSFDYTADARESERHDRIGLIYQNVIAAGRFGELMGHVAENGYGALNYIKADYINLIGASVLEVDDEVTRLKRRVCELENEVKQLKSIA